MCTPANRSWPRFGKDNDAEELCRKATFGMETMRETSGTEERTVYQGDTGSSAADFHGRMQYNMHKQDIARQS